MISATLKCIPKKVRQIDGQICNKAESNVTCGIQDEDIWAFTVQFFELFSSMFKNVRKSPTLSVVIRMESGFPLISIQAFLKLPVLPCWTNLLLWQLLPLCTFPLVSRCLASAQLGSSLDQNAFFWSLVSPVISFCLPYLCPLLIGGSFNWGFLSYVGRPCFYYF